MLDQPTVSPVIPDGIHPLIPSVLYPTSSHTASTNVLPSTHPLNTHYTPSHNHTAHGTTDRPTPASHESSHVNHNHAIGDTLALPKQPNTTRIYFQNINGITVANPCTWEPLCMDILNMDIDISLWAEHKLDTHQPWIHKQLHDKARKILGLGSYELQIASTPVTSRTSFKPGGVLSLIQGSQRGRILDRGTDPLGRWTYTKLRRNQGPPITIIVTYQVVDVDPMHSGPTTYATQLYAQYVQQDWPFPHKLRYHHTEDLVKLIQIFQQQGELIILAGDLNEELGLHTAGMTRLLQDCHLVDPIRHMHGHHTFSTYQRGTKVLDYILVDPSILSHVKAAGYEPFGNHILSDHRGVYIDLDTSRIFGSTILPLQPIQLRDLSTKRSHQIAPYFQHKKKYLEDHAWFRKIDAIQESIDTDQPNDSLAEELYGRLVTASQHAGRQLQRFPPAPYSPTIARLRQIRRFLKLELTQYKTGIDMTDQICVTRAKLGNIGHPIPTNKVECEQMLQQCTRKLRNAITDKTTTKLARATPELPYRPIH